MRFKVVRTLLSVTGGKLSSVTSNPPLQLFPRLRTLLASELDTRITTGQPMEARRLGRAMCSRPLMRVGRSWMRTMVLNWVGGEVLLFAARANEGYLVFLAKSSSSET